MFALALAVALFTLAVPRGVSAHQASTVYVTLVIDGRNVSLEVRLSSGDLGEPSGLSPLVVPTRAQFVHRTARASDYVQRRIHVRLGAITCPLAAAGTRMSPQPDRTERFSVTFALHARCSRQIDSLALRDDLFFDIDPRHQALVSVRAFGGTQQHVLLAGRREMVVVGTPSRLAQARDYVFLGVGHILTGYDHLAFLLALLILAATRPRREGVAQVLAVVTAFTVAHSITLALAVTDLVRLPTRAVECAIAASIAWVALENVLRASVRVRWPVTFAFGLVHGLGFASALAETGLPSRGTALALVSFNVGVEAGQLGVVALAFPMLRALGRLETSARGLLPGLESFAWALGTAVLLVVGGASPRVVLVLGIVGVPSVVLAASRVGYSRAVRQGVSTVIALFALFWLVERLAGRAWLGGWFG